MKHVFRKIEPRDIDQLFVVRTSVHENPMTLEELAGMGITAQSISDSLGDPLAGYVCEISGRILGFAMVDLKSGELSVIAVLSEHEKRGIGRELLKLTEELLWAAGHRSIWLWTGVDRNTRALRLYLSAGWIETEVKDQRIYLAKKKA